MTAARPTPSRARRRILPAVLGSVAASGFATAGYMLALLATAR